VFSAISVLLTKSAYFNLSPMLETREVDYNPQRYARRFSSITRNRYALEECSELPAGLVGCRSSGFYHLSVSVSKYTDKVIGLYVTSHSGKLISSPDELLIIIIMPRRYLWCCHHGVAPLREFTRFI